MISFFRQLGSITLLFNLVITFSSAQQGDFSIGVIADCQYCEDPGTGIRKYSLSDKKLSECVDHFNHLDLAYVIHLGDFIDRDFDSYRVVKPLYNSIKAPHYHVLGNHDFSVADSLKNTIPSILDMPSRYYSFDHANWRFIVLDGNDLSFHAYIQGSSNYQKSAQFYEENGITSPKWNGAISEEQFIWLSNTLDDAELKNLNVMLYCHFPIFPENIHNLWNASKLLQLLGSYQCVKAYVNGHNHEGNYDTMTGVHYLTLKGMVDTEETSYAIFHISENQIAVEGFGREVDRVLEIKNGK